MQHLTNDMNKLESLWICEGTVKVTSIFVVHLYFQQSHMLFLWQFNSSTVLPLPVQLKAQPACVKQWQPWAMWVAAFCTLAPALAWKHAATAAATEHQVDDSARSLHACRFCACGEMSRWFLWAQHLPDAEQCIRCLYDCEDWLLGANRWNGCSCSIHFEYVRGISILLLVSRTQSVEFFNLSKCLQT